jgi:hypothetical protein
MNMGELIEAINELKSKENKTQEDIANLSALISLLSGCFARRP